MRPMLYSGLAALVLSLALAGPARAEQAATDAGGVAAANDLLKARQQNARNQRESRPSVWMATGQRGGRSTSQATQGAAAAARQP